MKLFLLPSAPNNPIGPHLTGHVMLWGKPQVSVAAVTAPLKTGIGQRQRAVTWGLCQVVS